MEFLQQQLQQLSDTMFINEMNAAPLLPFLPSISTGQQQQQDAEFMQLDDNFADQFLNFNFETDDEPQNRPSLPPPGLTKGEQLLMELEQEIKNEPEIAENALWLDTTGEYATIGAVSPTPSIASLVDETSPKNTEELLFEFNAVCNAVRQGGSSMSPPESPKPLAFLNGIPIYYDDVHGEVLDAEILLDHDEDDTMGSDSNDFFDELIRSRSSSIPDCVSVASASPRSDFSSSSTSSSAFGSPSPRSDASFDVSGYDDAEWTPAIITTHAATPAAKRKKRPYGRPVEEKKVRKKEQNKNAATRYRQKKKQQLDDVLIEEERLKAIHNELQTQFDDTKREINYLKKLMREVMIAKGMKI